MALRRSSAQLRQPRTAAARGLNAPPGPPPTPLPTGALRVKTRKVFVSGEPAAGKTTALKRVAEHLRDAGAVCPPFFGFVTEDRRGAAGRVGFDIVVLHPPAPQPPPPVPNTRVALATQTALLPPGSAVGAGGKPLPTVGQYSVHVDAIDAVMVPVIQAAVASAKAHKVPPGDGAAAAVLVLDEVGKMELLSARFGAAVREALATPGLAVLGSVALYGRAPVVTTIHQRYTPFVMTTRNRELAPGTLMESLCN